MLFCNKTLHSIWKYMYARENKNKGDILILCTSFWYKAFKRKCTRNHYNISYFSCSVTLFLSINSGRQQFGRRERNRSALLHWRSRSLTLRLWLTITCVQGIRNLSYIKLCQTCSQALFVYNKQVQCLCMKNTKTSIIYVWLINSCNNSSLYFCQLFPLELRGSFIGIKLKPVNARMLLLI